MVATDDEQALIAKSQAGDHAAFESLIYKYQRMIHALCYRMTSSGSEADDLAQETFIRAHQQIKRFRSEARFSSWVYRIAVNQCLNWKQGKERRDRLHQDWSEANRGSQPEQIPAAQFVQEALMKLKAKQRAAVILTTYDGLSHAEAARVLGCSETTVSWRLFAARKVLKKLLRGLEGS